MRRHLLTAGKLLFVAGLMYWVLSNIQWRDSWVKIDPVAKQETRHFGYIQGAWDGVEVRFRSEDGGPPQVLRPDANLRVDPGLPTLWLNLRAGWFALGALCYLLTVSFASSRWWWLLEVNRLPIGYWAAYRYTWVGVFFNNVVPGQTGGDLVKAIYVMKRCHGERVPAMMSVVIDRILGLASLSLLAAIAVLFYLDNSEFATLAAVLWAVLAGVVLLGVVAFSRRIRSLIRLRDLLEKLPPKLSHVLKRIDHAVYFYRGHKTGIFVWLLLGTINHVLSVASYAFVGEALGVGIPMQDYFVLIPIIVIVSAVPIAPNGWGVGEFMFRRLFGDFGAPHLVGADALTATKVMGTRGVALSLLYRIHLTLWSLVGGVLFFFDKDKVTRAEMERQAAAEEVEEAQIDAEMEEASGAAPR
ncbi:MAG: flippase-like domain-containing protein [Planctomycetes bacterium]|nr:flippase-like domain-containing protein [Planctomycetota bacterium]